MTFDEFDKKCTDALKKAFKEERLNSADYEVEAELKIARYLTYRIKPVNNFKTSLKLLNMADLLELITGTTVNVTKYKEFFDISFRLPPNLREIISFNSLGGDAIGLTTTGEKVKFFLNSLEPNHLVGGITGSGKTELMKTILYYLTVNYSEEELIIYLCSAKRDYNDFVNCTHLGEKIQYSGDGIKKIIDKVYHTFETRRKANDDKGTRILLVLDEMHDPLVFGTKKSPPINPSNVEKITNLASQGRSFNFNLLLGTQSPNQTDFPFLKNIGNMWIGKAKKNNRVISEMISGNDASKLSGDGEFYQIVNGDIIRFQTAFITDISHLRRSDVVNEEVSEFIPKALIVKALLEKDIPEPEFKAQYSDYDILHYSDYIKFVKTIKGVPDG